MALSKTAKYYRDNPKAKKKKNAYTTKLESTPKRKKEKAERERKRYALKKKGVNVNGKDVSHTKNGMRLKDSSKNRGSKSDTAGDRRARGKKKRT